MRELATAERIRRLMQALGRAARAEGRAYLTGGATAVAEFMPVPPGWEERSAFVDKADRRHAPSFRRAVGEAFEGERPAP